MAYITIVQLSARLGATVYARLTDRVAGATADAAVAQQIVDEAEAEADGHLARRYATPIDLAARPELANVLEARVLDLAEYVAWKESPFVASVPDRVRELYLAAGRWFEQVGRGALDLPAGGLPAARVARSDAAQFTATERAFTAEELDGL